MTDDWLRLTHLHLCCYGDSHSSIVMISHAGFQSVLLCFFMVSSGDQEPTSEQLYSKGKLLYLVIASVFLIFPQNVICLQEETTPRAVQRCLLAHAVQVTARILVLSTCVPSQPRQDSRYKGFMKEQSNLLLER